jgi:DNA (cytosine-5)-methyltransferase 1
MSSKVGLNVVSLFAGAGGLEVAACSTGRIARMVSSDSNETFLSTTENNLSRHFPSVRHKGVLSDARELIGADLAAEIGGNVDVVMGGPPCDDFTKTGLRRGFSGNKGPLIFEFCRVVEEIGPSVVLFENVPNLATQFKSEYSAFLERIERSGYTVAWKLLSACDYGAPTMRKRIVMVGTKPEVGTYSFPEPMYGAEGESHLFGDQQQLKPFVPVRDALNDLPDVEPDGAVSEAFLNHVGVVHRPQTIEHFKSIRAGVDTRQSFRYRSPWDGLCRSLTAGLDDRTKAYLHPVFHREMTVREYARIQGFPDTWFFEGTRHNGIKQVANSVPVPLGAAIWENIHSLLISAHRGTSRRSKPAVK